MVNIPVVSKVGSKVAGTAKTVGSKAKNLIKKDEEELKEDVTTVEEQVVKGTDKVISEAQTQAEEIVAPANLSAKVGEKVSNQ